MPEILKDLLEVTLSAIVRLWKRFAGSPEYEVQESKVRIPDSGRVVYVNDQLRRSSHSGLDCDRY